MCSLDNIVTELVQQEGRNVGSQVLRDKSNFLRGLHALDDLLRSPCTVLVNADHGEMWAEALQHSQTGAGGALLEQLLNDLLVGWSITTEPSAS